MVGFHDAGIAPLTIHEVVTDKAGHQTDLAGNAVTFTYETMTPTTTIVMPSATKINYLPTLSGTAADFYADGLQKIYVSIQRMKDNKYFNGTFSAWLNGQTWNDVSLAGGTSSLSTNATSWVYAPAGLNGDLSFTTYYVILTSATDVAGNVQTGFVAGISSFTFLYDNQAPTVNISFPQNGVAYQYGGVGQDDTPLEGSAVDNPTTPPNADLKPAVPGGPGGVQIRLSYVTGGTTYYWNNSAIKFDSSISSTTAWIGTDDNSWEYGVFTPLRWPTTSYSYLLEVQAIDQTLLADGSAGSGNVSLATPVTFIVDNASPTVAIAWPLTGSAPKNLPTISGNAVDDTGGSGVQSVYLQISSGTSPSYYYYTGSGWTNSATWVLVSSSSLGGGAVASPWTYNAPPWTSGQSFYLKMGATDFAGNTSFTSVSTFTFDTTLATVTITYPSNGGYYSGVTVSTITGTAVDSIVD